MREDIRTRIEMIDKRIVPEGYKIECGRIIPVDWYMVSVGDAVQRVSNKVKVDKDEEYKQIGIRSHGKGIFYKDPVKGSELGNKSVYWISDDCFIVNIVFAWEQAVAKTTKNEVGMIASHRFPMYRANPTMLDLDFLLKAFKTNRGKYELEIASPGGAGRNKTLGQENFSEINLFIPRCIEEQKRIVEVLDTIDYNIELKTRLIEEKNNEKLYLMQLLLTGKKRLNGFNDKWNRVPICKIANISIGKTPDRNNDTYWGEGSKWVSIADISKSSKYLQETKEQITKDAILDTKIKMVPKGTIIMSFKLSIGKLAILNEDMYTNEAICHFDINEDKVDREYLYYYMSYIDVSKFGSQAVKGITLNQETLSGIMIKLPCMKEQEIISDILSTQDRYIETMEKELKQLEKQKKGLMNLLLTGQVRVNEINNID